MNGLGATLGQELVLDDGIGRGRSGFGVRWMINKVGVLRGEVSVKKVGDTLIMFIMLYILVEQNVCMSGVLSGNLLREILNKVPSVYSHAKFISN